MQDGVEELFQQRAGVRSSDDMDFQHEESDENSIPPEFTALEISREAKDDHEENAASIQRSTRDLDAPYHIISNGRTVLPLQDIRPEALVCEPFDRIAQRVLRALQQHEVVVRGIDGLRIVNIDDLVRVVQGRHSAELGFDLLVVRVRGDAEGLVEIARLADPVVGLEQRVQQVDDDDGDLDASSVLRVARGARCGLGVAGADGDAIVDGLDPSGYHL